MPRPRKEFREIKCGRDLKYIKQEDWDKVEGEFYIQVLDFSEQSKNDKNSHVFFQIK